MSSRRINVSLSPELVQAIMDHDDYQPAGGTRSGLGGWLYQAGVEKLELPAEDYHEARSRYWASKKDK